MDRNDMALLILGCLVGLALLIVAYFALFGHVSITSEALS